jgi:hypothetical protein
MDDLVWDRRRVSARQPFSRPTWNEWLYQDFYWMPCYMVNTILAIDRVVTRWGILFLSSLLAGFTFLVLRILFLNRNEMIDGERILISGLLNACVGLPLFYLFDKSLGLQASTMALKDFYEDKKFVQSRISRHQSCCDCGLSISTVRTLESADSTEPLL